MGLNHWEAIRDLALSWASIDLVDEVARELPGNRLGRGKLRGVPEILQLVHAMAGSATGQPLLLGTVVPAVLRAGPLPGGPTIPQREMNDWLDKAQKVAIAQFDTVAWVRSRLPGYPLILAPQLAPGCERTLDEVGGHLFWRRNDFGAQYQFETSPPRVADVFGADHERARELTRLAGRLISALETTDEWKQFDEAHRALSSPDRHVLRDARTDLRKRVAATAVDAHDSMDIWARGQYRRAELNAVIDRLEGAALAYSNAFVAVDDLIDLVVGDVFAQLVCFGDPITVAATDLAFGVGGPGNVAFNTTMASILPVPPGTVVRLDDLLVRDALLVTQTSMSLEATGTERMSLRGRLLKGTGDAWAST